MYSGVSLSLVFQLKSWQCEKREIPERVAQDILVAIATVPAANFERGPKSDPVLLILAASCARVACFQK